MTSRFYFTNAIIGLFLLFRLDAWITEDHGQYKLFYQEEDLGNITDYKRFIDGGIIAVDAFFTDSFRYKFDIYVHPHRSSLDSQWQKDWKMPTFKSECWMVASGTGNKLGMVSPVVWEKEACEHRYSDKVHTQQILTHELVHVFHGQYNISPGFDETYGIDWFVEGLAGYASGQCDKIQLSDVKKLILENKAPSALDSFWTGRFRYAQSGSMVLYIDRKYGRTLLKQLLKFNKKTDILAALKVTEEDLIRGWKKYIGQMRDDN